MRRRFALLAALILGCAAGETALSASLEVVPARIELPPGQLAATVEVWNHGNRPTAIQARPFDWSQLGDRDILSPTDNVVLSPPIFTVPAGASQVVRLLLRNATVGAEQAYRLLIDEIPAPPASRQIAIALRVSMPVIAAPETGAPARLRWRAEREADRLLLVATNMGQRYASVNDLKAALEGGRDVPLRCLGATPYLLPGDTRRWLLVQMPGAPPPRGTLKLRVTTQAGTLEQVLTLPP